MTNVLFPEWRAENENNAYPFSSAATLTADDGTTILQNMFIDAVLYPVGGKAGMYLASAVVTHDSVKLYIGDEDSTELCSGSFNLSNPENNVTLVDAYGRPAGVLISTQERLAFAQAWGIGTHEFSREQTEFAAAVCMPTPNIGIRGVMLPDGTVKTGDIWFVGSNGVILRHEDSATPETNCIPMAQLPAIRVDVVGDPLFRRRLCDPSGLFVTPRFIKTLRIIQGDKTFECGPDEFGNFRIVTGDYWKIDTALRVKTTPAGLTFEIAGTPA